MKAYGGRGEGVAVLILNFGVEINGWPHNPVTLSRRKEVMVPIQ